MQSLENVNQLVLFKVVSAIFPDHEVKTNSRKTAQITNPNTGKYLELDVWVPALNISFEFQDPYHYTATWDSHETLQHVQKKDTLKSDSVKEKGETLVIVPYWWNGSQASLQATIAFYRPDLAWKEKKKHNPIPLNPKIGHLAGLIPHVGALMLASFPTSSRFDETISPVNSWWVGEKYDGVRFCWNPKTIAIYTRSGVQINIPDQFRNKFPSSFLDGELWFGRGGFQDSQRLILSIATNTTWANLRSMVFDNPDMLIEHLPFEKRYKRLLSVLDIHHPFITISFRFMISNFRKLANCVETIIKDGGEGVILRRPASLYERGRSNSLLKFKATRGDKEALVVHDQGDFLIMQLPDGVRFEIPKQAAAKLGPSPPKKGDIVTFTYEKYSRKEAPVNPTLLRIRKDVSWEHVVKDFNLSTPQSQVLSESSSKVGKFSVDPLSRERKKRKMRIVFEKAARALHLNPLLVSTWYSVKRSDLLKTKGIATVLSIYNGSLVNAVLDLFPEIGIDKSKFSQLPKHYWRDMANRRKYFEDYAKEKGFDALSPDAWYPVQISDLFVYKNAKNVLYFHSKQSRTSSFAKTLKEVFPEVVFDDTKFPKTPAYFLRDYNNRRRVLEDFAAQNKFNPLVAHNWYSIPTKRFYESKAVFAVLRHYEKSVSRALIHLFPDIGLETGKFLVSPNNYWLDKNNRRKFFEDFANKKHFDPLIASNWYPISGRAFINKGGATILHSYKNYKEALLDLFPNIGLEISNFKHMN